MSKRLLAFVYLFISSFILPPDGNTDEGRQGYQDLTYYFTQYQEGGIDRGTLGMFLQLPEDRFEKADKMVRSLLEAEISPASINEMLKEYVSKNRGATEKSPAKDRPALRKRPSKAKPPISKEKRPGKASKNSPRKVASATDSGSESSESKLQPTLDTQPKPSSLTIKAVTHERSSDNQRIDLWWRVSNCEPGSATMTIKKRKTSSEFDWADIKRAEGTQKESQQQDHEVVSVTSEVAVDSWKGEYRFSENDKDSEYEFRLQVSCGGLKSHPSFHRAGSNPSHYVLREYDDLDDFRFSTYFGAQYSAYDESEWAEWMSLQLYNRPEELRKSHDGWARIIPDWYVEISRSNIPSGTSGHDGAASTNITSSTTSNNRAFKLDIGWGLKGGLYWPLLHYKTSAPKSVLGYDFFSDGDLTWYLGPTVWGGFHQGEDPLEEHGADETDLMHDIYGGLRLATNHDLYFEYLFGDSEQLSGNRSQIGLQVPLIIDSKRDGRVYLRSSWNWNRSGRDADDDVIDIILFYEAKLGPFFSSLPLVGNMFAGKEEE